MTSAKALSLYLSTANTQTALFYKRLSITLSKAGK